jgi:hypothetical protein
MGGNVFQGTSDFDHKHIKSILDTVNQALAGTGIECIPVGSAATPKPGKRSGDLDVIVDEEAVLNYFDVRDPKAGRKMLNDYIAQKGLDTAQSGINVHVRVPVGNESHQVDIMVVNNAPTVAKFHTHNIPDNSPYKGKHKQLLMAILAKDKGMMWSAWQGLFSRNEAGKKGDFVTSDLDEIARILLGDGANANDLGSVESMLAKVPNKDELLSRAEQDRNWTTVTAENVATEQKWFRNIMDLVQ